MEGRGEGGGGGGKGGGGVGPNEGRYQVPLKGQTHLRT